MSGLRTLIGRLALADEGLSLVEFAFALPILLLLYLGGYQLSDAIACNRKVTIAARAVADLTSQFDTSITPVTAAQIATVLDASAQIMAPYDAANALVRVSEIQIDPTGKPVLVWSQAKNGSKLTDLNTLSVPSQLTSMPNTYLILSQVNYAYTPAVTYGAVGPLSLADAIYMSPRRSQRVDCSDCT